jgi:hypothetical protein
MCPWLERGGAAGPEGGEEGREATHVGRLAGEGGLDVDEPAVEAVVGAEGRQLRGAGFGVVEQRAVLARLRRARVQSREDGRRLET